MDLYKLMGDKMDSQNLVVSLVSEKKLVNNNESKVSFFVLLFPSCAGFNDARDS